MELALNLVWLFVAIVRIGVLWRSLSCPARPNRPASNWRKIVAISCALIILFFVISMTDDLHDQEIMVEDNRSSRIVNAARISAPYPSGHAISAVFLLFSAVASFAPSLPSARRPVDRPKIISAAEMTGERLHGRARPAAPASTSTSFPHPTSLRPTATDSTRPCRRLF